MWTRKSVKQRGKKAFYLNYWKCVLVALILCFVIGAAGGNSSGGSYSIPALTSQFTNSDTDIDPDIDIEPDIEPDIDPENTQFERILLILASYLKLVFFAVLRV